MIEETKIDLSASVWEAYPNAIDVWIKPDGRLYHVGIMHEDGDTTWITVQWFGPIFGWMQA